MAFFSRTTRLFKQSSQSGMALLRHKRSRMLQNAVVESLEPRLLMSTGGVKAAHLDSVGYTLHYYGGEPGTGILMHETAKLSWTNYEDDPNAIIYVEVAQPNSLFTTNYSTLMTLSSTNSSYSFEIPLGGIYDYRIVTQTPGGSAISNPLTNKSDTSWEDDVYALSVGGSSDSLTFTWDDSGSAASYTGIVGGGNEPFPNLWHPDGVSLYSDPGYFPYNFTGGGTSAAGAIVNTNLNGAFSAGGSVTMAFGSNLSDSIDLVSFSAAEPETPPSVTGTYSAGTYTLVASGVPTGADLIFNGAGTYDFGSVRDGNTDTFSWGNILDPQWDFDNTGSETNSSLLGAPAGYYGASYDVTDGDYTYESSVSSLLDLVRARTPESPEASQIGDSSILVQWANNNFAESGYTIERSYDHTNWSVVGYTSADVCQFYDDSIVDGETYYYRIQANRSDSSLNSDWTEYFSPTNPDGGCPFCSTLQFFSQAANQALNAIEGILGGITNKGGSQTPVASIQTMAGIPNVSAVISNENTNTSPSESGAGPGGYPSIYKLYNGKVMIESGDYRLYFAPDEGWYVPDNEGNTFNLTLNSTTHQFLLSDGVGDQAIFPDVSTGSSGQLISYADANGNTDFATYSSTTVISQVLSDPGTLTYTYSYAGSNLSSVTLTNSNSTVPTNTLTYGYYGAGENGGNSGDLKWVITTDDTGDWEMSYMRYYTSGNYVGGLEYITTEDSTLRLLASDGVTQPWTMNATSLAATLASMTNATVATYADLAYTYDQAHRVTSITAQGNGCSVCTGGQGTTTFDYYVSGYTGTDYNTWKYRTTETLPGFDSNNTANTANTQIVTFSNGYGQTLLTATIQTATGEQSINYYRYDSGGEQILHVNPSGVLGYNEYEYPDLVDFDAPDNTALDLSSSLGLFEWSDYYGSYLQDTSISHGLGGTPHYQSYYDYVENTVNGVSYYNIADSVTFSQDVTSSPSTASSGAQVTQIAYTWASSGTNGSTQLVSSSTTLPIVSTANNGAGTSANYTTTTVYDSYGRPVWTKDADGFISYTAYDEITGAVVKTITDVNTNATSEFMALPSGWASPSTVSALNLVTTYQVDTQGRTTEETDPNGNVSYTVYDDTDHAVFSFPDVVVGTNSQFTTTGPASMSRTDLPYSYTQGTLTVSGTYDEMLTFGGTFTLSGSTVILPGFVTSGTSGDYANLLNFSSTDSSGLTLQSLSRTLYNAGSQMVESDAYYNIGTNPAYTYLHSTATGNAHTGSVGTNFYATTYGYNVRGLQARVVSSNGTITDTIYDVLDREAATYVGTNDSVGTNNWETFIHQVTANATDVTGTNMTMVSSNQYDGGGIGNSSLASSGNSNLTTTTLYPGGGQANRVTDYLYDWRDRQVTTVTGVGAASGTHAPITVNTLDNLGEVIATKQYDGDGLTLSGVNADGTPTSGLSSSALRAYSTTQYDDQGRAFKTVTYSVNPADGTYSTVSSSTLVSETWYDQRGDTIATWSSGGPMTKMTYDGAGRVTTTYTTDGGAVGNSGSIRSTWADANSVNNDIVLTQSSTDYDANGNAIETVMAERNHSVSGTGRLFTITTIDTSTTNAGSFVVSAAGGTLSSRIYYTSDYYDPANRSIASVNVGDAGGSSYERPATAPTASTSTLLLTVQHYNDAGELNIVTDPKGFKSNTLYDLLGNTLFSVSAWDGTYSASIGTFPVSATANQTTAYTWDGDGHMTSETAVMPSGQSSQTTAFIYNLANATALGVTTTPKIFSNDLLWAVENPILSGASAGQPGTTANLTTIASYDALGETLTNRDQNGNTHTYSYDALGRITSDAVTTSLTLANGSFESPVVGTGNYVLNATGGTWNIAGDAGVASYASALATLSGYSGVQVGFLKSTSSDTSGSMTQTVYVSVGGSYEIKFNAAQTTGSNEVIEVLIDGHAMGEFTATSSSFTAFTSDPVALTTGNHTLTLEAAAAKTGTNIAFVDSVLLTQATSSSLATVTVNDSSFQNQSVSTFTYNPTGSSWSFTGQGGLAAYGSTMYSTDNAYSGSSQVAFLESKPVSVSGQMSQTLTFTTGGTYFVEFQTSSRDPDDGEEIVVQLDGTTISDVNPANGEFDLVVSDSFTVAAGSHVLSFSAVTDPSAGDYAALVDDVQVVGQAALGILSPVLAITTSYNSQGLTDTVTSYNAASGGSVVNQVENLYNGFGQLIQQYQNPNGAVVTGTGSGHSLSVQYAYDTSNTFTSGSRLVSMTYPSGQVLYYNYGSTGSLNSVISRLDNMVGSDDKGGTTTLESYQYLGLGTVIQRTENQPNIALTYIGSAGGDGGDVYRGLDRFGRIIDQKWVENASGSTLDEYTYTYDADSNVLTKDNIVAENASNASFDQTYTYDNLNQLTSAYNGTNNVQSYTLDALGNITGQTNGTSSSVTSTFNAQNQLITDGSATLAFDADGNTTVDDQGRTLIFDAWNRLIGVNSTAGTMIASYSFDGMGRRVTQSSPGTNPIVMFYDAGGQLLEQDISSSGLALQGQYVWSAGAGYQNALVLRDFAFSGSGFTLNERTYALQDANWNVTALVGYSTLPGDTNANGTVDFSDLVRLEQYYDHYAAGGSAVGDFNHDGYVDFNDLLTLLQHDNTSSTFSSWTVFERISYSPYGVMSTYTPTFTANSDFLAWNVGFQGMLYDAQTGFNYTLTRVYEASTGRFLTVDPAHADGMNWFRGFGGNPINFNDPTGLSGESLAIKIENILGFRLGSAIGTFGVGLLWNWGEYLLDKDTYRLNDDLGEMNTLTQGQMISYYEYLVENDFHGQISETWKTFTTPKQSAKAAVGQFEVIENGFASTAWWLGGAHDVKAGGSFEARTCSGQIQLRNIHMDWEWDDRIHGNSFIQGKANWHGAKIVYITEGIWDLTADKIASADFGVQILWKSFEWPGPDGHNLVPVSDNAYVKAKK